MRFPFRLGPLLGVVALLGFAWLAIETYRARIAPERAPDLGAALVGPSGRVLEEAADRRIEHGLEELNDLSRPVPERYEAFVAELHTAEGLLIRSLHAQPASATVLAKLAAVRWELEPPLSEEATHEQLELIGLASRLAPASPRVHFGLAELLLKMGRTAEAAPYLSRAVALDSSRAAAAVRLLAERGTSAEEIAAVLPRDPRVLAALERPFSVQRRLDDYVAIVEQAFDEPGGWSSPTLLASYGDACLTLAQPERLRLRMEGAGPLEDPSVEAERLRQRARAWLAAGNAAHALDDARAAARQAPDSPAFAEYQGDVALATGDAAGAVAAFQDALARAARGPGEPHLRARLYRKIGQAEERRGSGDRAYDAYRMALRLNPAEAHARKRVEETRRAAGLEP